MKTFSFSCFRASTTRFRALWIVPPFTPMWMTQLCPTATFFALFSNWKYPKIKNFSFRPIKKQGTCYNWNFLNGYLFPCPLPLHLRRPLQWRWRVMWPMLHVTEQRLQSDQFDQAVFNLTIARSRVSSRRLSIWLFWVHFYGAIGFSADFRKWSEPKSWAVFRVYHWDIHIFAPVRLSWKHLVKYSQRYFSDYRTAMNDRVLWRHRNQNALNEHHLKNNLEFKITTSYRGNIYIGDNGMLVTWASLCRWQLRNISSSRFCFDVVEVFPFLSSTSYVNPLMLRSKNNRNVTDTSVTHYCLAKTKFRCYFGIKIWPLLDNGNLKILKMKSPNLEMTLTMIKYCLWSWVR